MGARIMPDQNIKELEERLHGCHDCAILFMENAALIEDENGSLTPEQVLAVLIRLDAVHKDHVY